MDRRNFLQGVFGGVTAAGLIIAVDPLEAAAMPLKLDEPLIIVPTVPLGEYGDY